MSTRCPKSLASGLILFCATFVAISGAASAQTVTPICSPKILANRELVTPAQRKAAGEIAQPPLTDAADGFAWPDTPMGVIKDERRLYILWQRRRLSRQPVLAGTHRRQQQVRLHHSHHGYSRQPSRHRTTRRRNHQPESRSFGQSLLRELRLHGRRPCLQSSGGHAGSRPSWLMVYHAEIPTVTTQSFYSVLALASSADQGLTLDRPRRNRPHQSGLPLRHGWL